MDNNYPKLRKQLKEGNNFKNGDLNPWTKENILAGLKKFFDENGRYPTALEIDSYEYLPSSRQIQRTFGGLVKLRQDLGLNVINYSSGAPRSAIAKIVNNRGRNSEREMESILIRHFGEYYVHIEKPLNNYYSDLLNVGRSGKNRADFFVYGKDYKFCVDVFYPSNVHNFVNIIGMKQSNYTGLNIDVYLVNMNCDGNITDQRIESYKRQRFTQMEANIKIMNKNSFIELIKTFEPILI